jgi:hypothetical protein
MARDACADVRMTPDPADPRPVKPVSPAAEDCCGEGCAHCVYDLYDLALERYEAELAAWLARHPGPEQT